MRSLAPFLKILPLVVVGVLLGEVVSIRWWVVALAATTFSVGAVVLKSKSRVGQIYIITAIILWGLSTSLLHTPQSATQRQSIVEAPATIRTAPYHTSGRWVRTEATAEIEGRERLLLVAADTTIQNLSLGARGQMSGLLVPLPEGSYGRLMLRRGYYGTIYLTSDIDWLPTDTISTPTIAARRVQQHLLRQVRKLHLAPDNEAVVEAMMLGWRGGITQELRKDYSRAGASHLLAISGLHVGLVALVVWWLCYLLPLVGRRGHIVRNVVASVVMILYAIVTGLSPSVVRATLMFCTAQMALAYGTSGGSANTLCGAATLMLLANPNNLYDISFQLSMIAVVGIAVGYGPIGRWLGAESGRRWLRWVVGIVVVALCSTLATLPLVAHTFGTVSLVGIFLNPIVIVTAEIIVMGGFIWVSLPLEPLAPIARAIIGGAAELQNRLVSEAASHPWAAAEMNIPAWVVGVAYGAMAVALIVAEMTKEKRIDKWRTKSWK